MKIRSGFVSNSSSSSFIIAVRPDAKTCKCCGRSDAFLLQLLAKYIATLTKDNHKLYTMYTAKDVEDYFKKELEDFVSSKAHAIEQLATIKELLKDKKTIDNFSKIQTQLQVISYGFPIHKEDPGMTKVQFSLESRRDGIQKHLVEYDNKVKALKEKIAKVKAFNKKGWTVYAFTMDNWATEAESMIKAMTAEEDLVVVIERINT